MLLNIIYVSVCLILYSKLIAFKFTVDGLKHNIKEQNECNTIEIL